MLTEAPSSSSNSTNSTCAKNEAMCKAVLPSLFAIETSAPFSISTFAMPVWPNTAAEFSGVDPLPACLALTDTPDVKSCVTFSRLPRAVALQMSIADEALLRGFSRADAAASSFAPSVRQYSLDAVRISSLSPATAGLEMQSSSRSFLSTISNSGPALTTYVKPSSLRKNRCPL